MFGEGKLFDFGWALNVIYIEIMYYRNVYLISI